MNHSKTTVFCHREPFWGSIKFWIRSQSSRDGVTNIAYASPLTLTRITPDLEAVEQPPAFELKNEEAQNLMDSLWTIGFRPTEGSGSAGSLAATQKHLEDMRALVFKIKPKSADE